MEENEKDDTKTVSLTLYPCRQCGTPTTGVYCRQCAGVDEEGYLLEEICATCRKLFGKQESVFVTSEGKHLCGPCYNARLKASSPPSGETVSQGQYRCRECGVLGTRRLCEACAASMTESPVQSETRLPPEPVDPSILQGLAPETTSVEQDRQFAWSRVQELQDRMSNMLLAHRETVSSLRIDLQVEKAASRQLANEQMVLLTELALLRNQLSEETTRCTELGNQVSRLEAELALRNSWVNTATVAAKKIEEQALADRNQVTKLERELHDMTCRYKAVSLVLAKVDQERAELLRSRS